jgi:DNA gyrase subunit A
MAMGEKNTAVTACFPISPNQEIILVTDGGQLIRCPVADVRIAARKTMGVRLFNVAEGEHVVSVASVPEENGDGGEGDAADEAASGEAAGEQQDGAASGGDGA